MTLVTICDGIVTLYRLASRLEKINIIGLRKLGNGILRDFNEKPFKIYNF